jgi:hypothetical protein
VLPRGGIVVGWAIENLRFDAADAAFDVGAGGALTAPGVAATAGVLPYRRGGRIVRELVTPEVLANKADLKLLETCPVVIKHPQAGYVTPHNVAYLGVGDIRSARVEGGKLLVDGLTVRPAEAQERLRADKGLRYLSCGYAVELDHTPGVHPVYGPYDAVQTRRIYNHLAIEHSARGGGVPGLNLDSGDTMSALATMLLAAALVRDDTEGEAAKLVRELKEGRELKAKYRADAADTSALEEAIRADERERTSLIAMAVDLKLDASKLSTSELRKTVALAKVPSLRMDAADDYYRAALDFAKAKPSEPPKPAEQPARFDAADPPAVPTPSPRRVGYIDRINAAVYRREVGQ